MVDRQEPRWTVGRHIVLTKFLFCCSYLGDLVDIARKILHFGFRWKEIALQLEQDWKRPVHYYNVKYAWNFIRARRSELTTYLYNLVQYMPREIADRMLEQKSHFFGIDDDVCTHTLYRDWVEDLVEYGTQEMRLQAFEARIKSRRRAPPDFKSAKQTYRPRRGEKSVRPEKKRTSEDYSPMPNKKRIKISKQESGLKPQNAREEKQESQRKLANVGAQYALAQEEPSTGPTADHPSEIFENDCMNESVLLASTSFTSLIHVPLSERADTPEIDLQHIDRFHMIPIEPNEKPLSDSWHGDLEAMSSSILGSDTSTISPNARQSAILNDEEFASAAQHFLKQFDQSSLMNASSMNASSTEDIHIAASILDQVKRGVPFSAGDTLGPLPRICAEKLGSNQYFDPLDNSIVEYETATQLTPENLSLTRLFARGSSFL